MRADAPRARAGDPPGADRDDRDPREAVVRGLRRGPAAGGPRRRRRRGSMSVVDVDRLAKLPLFGELDNYGPGQVVGEISLIDPQRRTATVRATSEVRAVALPLEHLDRLEGEMPEIVRKLRWI